MPGTALEAEVNVAPLVESTGYWVFARDRCVTILIANSDSGGLLKFWLNIKEHHPDWFFPNRNHCLHLHSFQIDDRHRVPSSDADIGQPTVWMK